MKKDNNIDIEQFKKAYNLALKRTAQRIGREIEKSYEAQIQRFYEDYSPISYIRTGATWLASSGMQNYQSWSEYLGDLQYQAGITVDPTNIQDKKGDPYRAETQWVFNRTWHYGIHGINRNNIRSKIITRGRGKNKREFEVKWNYRKFPTNTRPSPETEFIKSFNKIKQHNHIDDLFSYYYEKEFNKMH